MLTITQAARDYFSRLIGEQPEGTGLRLRVLQPGTPAADVDLSFCPPGQHHANDQAVDCQQFKLFVDADAVDSLAGAVIDFESDSMGGELSIRAPGLKGAVPDETASLHERVAWLLEARINPMVAAHGGRVGLVEVTEHGDVVLQFGGGCHGCGMVDVTLKQGIEKTMKQEIPEVRSVVDATDHATGTNPYC